MIYTFGCTALEDKYNSTRKETDCGGCMLHSVRGSGSSNKRRLKSRRDSISLYKKPSLPSNKVKLLHCTSVHFISKLDLPFCCFGVLMLVIIDVTGNLCGGT